MSSSQRQHQQRQQRKTWENVERHYCEYCNAWMGSDRQSILLHEQGKKHVQNVEAALLKKRQERAAKEKNASYLQKVAQQMEASAAQSREGQQLHAPFINAQQQGPAAGANHYQQYYNNAATQQQPFAATSSSSAIRIPATSTTGSQQQNEKKEWIQRKKQREEENKRKQKKKDGGVGDDDSDDSTEIKQKKKKLKIKPDEGHYTRDGQVYLEGGVFGEGILEVDMPIQLWVGNLLATSAEKQLPHNQPHWKDAIVAGIRRKRQHQAANVGDDRMVKVVDVAYLKDSGGDDEKEGAQRQKIKTEDEDGQQAEQKQQQDEETLEKSVPLHRIRIVLGGDESIPDTLEEARLLAMGGEEEVIKQKVGRDLEQDEATGLSSWTTVKVKRTTVRQELKEERERLRQKRRREALEQEKLERQKRERQMEEAKVMNADDSALGAYDVWETSAKSGYKGVNMFTGEANVSAEEMAKKLAPPAETSGATTSSSTGFKKAAFGKKSKKKKQQNRRTTSADD